MSLFRSLRRASVISFIAVAACTAVASTGCDSGDRAKTAKIPHGPMPEGEEWTGVYFHPVYGYLHLVEEGSNIVGRWKRADQSKWGELSGTRAGNVFHYQWKEHTIGMVGASATVHGKGYFVYKIDKDSHAVLDGEFGLNADEVGSDWHNIKQARMQPDLKSIGGDSEGVQPGAF